MWRGVGGSEGGGDMWQGVGGPEGGGDKCWLDGTGLTPLMKPRAWSNSDRSIVSSLASGKLEWFDLPKKNKGMDKQNI